MVGPNVESPLLETKDLVISASEKSDQNPSHTAGGGGGGDGGGGPGPAGVKLSGSYGKGGRAETEWGPQRGGATKTHSSQTGRKATGQRTGQRQNSNLLLRVVSGSKSTCEESDGGLNVLKCVWTTNRYR